MKENIEYAFTAVPTKLMILLDVNCRSMLFTLIQLNSYFVDDNGWFFRTNLDLVQESGLSQKIVIATIDTLYREGIIDVRTVGKANGKHSNRFKINFERFVDFEKIEMEQLKNPELKIKMVDYRQKGYAPSYLNTTQDNPKVITNNSQSTNNINNIDIRDNTDNRNIIENIEIEDNSNINSIINIVDDEEIKDSYRTKVLELVNIGCSIPKILTTLAKNDWDCYTFYKKELFNNDKLRVEFANNRELIEELNNKFNPHYQY